MSVRHPTQPIPWLQHQHSCKHLDSKCSCLCEYNDAHKCGAGKAPAGPTCADNAQAKQFRHDKHWKGYRKAFKLQPIGKDRRKAAQIVCGGMVGAKEVVRCFSWEETKDQKFTVHVRKSLRKAGTAPMRKFCQAKLAEELGSKVQVTEHIVSDRFMNDQCKNYAALASKVGWATRKELLVKRVRAAGKGFVQAFRDAHAGGKIQDPTKVQLQNLLDTASSTMQSKVTATTCAKSEDSDINALCSTVSDPNTFILDVIQNDLLDCGTLVSGILSGIMCSDSRYSACSSSVSKWVSERGSGSDSHDSSRRLVSQYGDDDYSDSYDSGSGSDSGSYEQDAEDLGEDAVDACEDGACAL